MSRLASRELDEPTTLKVRFKMWLHFLICVWCKRYDKHLRFLHQAAPQLPEELELLSLRGLSLESKEKMKTRLRFSDV